MSKGTVITEFPIRNLWLNFDVYLVCIDSAMVLGLCHMNHLSVSSRTPRFILCNQRQVILNRLFICLVTILYNEIHMSGVI